ncbi:hypothetical protein SISSUDRAFT_313259 [Sistotremastrum suecicum HHB10207 ss-3]|uniref:Uncharacterized protein n=1 Tax=Sistotremastrum suecicum HHB10207 ss-3 TaxID=1314776 RepID=A0A165ZC02_9AGAM|nr:hypothetical protein SISSUDRAFT_313259 [Sistotremastrum suecicum HHB10207 ss-3]
MIEGNRNVISSLEERFESFRDVSYDVGRFMDIVSIKMMNSASEGAEGSVARTWESIRRRSQERKHRDEHHYPKLRAGSLRVGGRRHLER